MNRPDVPFAPCADRKRNRRPSGRNSGQRWLASPGPRRVTRHRRAARGRNPLERARGRRRKNDGAVSIPRAAAPIRGVGNDVQEAALDVDRLELAVGEEAERAPVGRPERKDRTLGARKCLWRELIEPLQEQLRRAVGNRGEHDGLAIRRQRERHRLVRERCRDEESHRLRRLRRRTRHPYPYQKCGCDSADSGRDPEPLDSPTSRVRYTLRRLFLGRPCQLSPQVARRLPAIVWILGQTGFDDPPDLEWRHRRVVGERRRIAFQNRGDDSHVAVGVERLPSGEHLVEHGPERKDIGARVDRLALELLGGHVLDGAHDGSHGGEVGRRSHTGCSRGEGRRHAGFRQTEVEQLCCRHSAATVPYEEYVARFQIAMHDAGAMCAIQSGRDLRPDRERLGNRQRALRQTRGQGLALEILHDEERGALFLADVVQRADVGVRQLRNGPSFTSEAFAELRIFRKMVREHLDRDDAIQTRVTGLVDLAHPA